MSFKCHHHAESQKKKKKKKKFRCVIPVIRFMTSELARKDTSFVSMTHLILNITVYLFQYGGRTYFWAAFLDLKVNMVSDHSKTHYITIRCVIPELTRNDTSIALLFSLYQKMSLFWFFNMSSAAILGCHLELESQDRPKIQ